MKKDEAIKKIELLIYRLNSLPQYQHKGDNSEFDKWYRDTEIAIEKIFGQETRHHKDFTDIRFCLSFYISGIPSSEYIQKHHQGRREAQTVLESFIDEIKEYWDEKKLSVEVDSDYKSVITNILRNFHRAARQLLIRYSDRTTLEISDEYDVQDLLHSYLKLNFDDVRAEETTPSYAGKSSRIDFLLSDQKIAIEVKKTRDNLKDKEVGNELIIDIVRYESHPKVKTLFCFVYDPESKIRNPAGLENDLSKKYNNLDVQLVICPKI